MQAPNRLHGEHQPQAASVRVERQPQAASVRDEHPLAETKVSSG